MLVATWNVNSILARIPNVIRWLDLNKPDVLCMQETKCTDDKFPLEPFTERGYHCQLFGQQSYNGVAIVSRGSCDTSYRGYPGDDETAQSRLIATTVNGIRVINVYIPNGQMVGSEKYAFKLEWMKRLRFYYVGISTSLLKRLTFTIHDYGRAEFFLVIKNERHCNSSKTGASPIHFDCITHCLDSIHGGTIGLEPFGATSDCGLIMFG